MDEVCKRICAVPHSYTPFPPPARREHRQSDHRGQSWRCHRNREPTLPEGCRGRAETAGAEHIGTADSGMRGALDPKSGSNPPDHPEETSQMVKTIAPAVAAHDRLALIGGQELDYFRRTGADLKADAEAGDMLAAAEISRRKANRASKSAARKAASA